MTRGFRLNSRLKYKTGPALLKGAGGCADLPLRRKGGEFVTMRNCATRECRWPYGEAGADMVMCGRESAPGKPYCTGHQALTLARRNPNE